MPKVVADITTTTTCNLQSAPPDGFVKLRRLSYGEVLDSQKIGAKGVREGSQMSLRTDLLAVQQYLFARMVIDHNLEDEQGNKLDFHNPMDVARLLPSVGEEIQEYCEKLNEGELDAGNLPKKSDELSLPESPQTP